jgi:thiamine-phosphate pyrophosphorylase
MSNADMRIRGLYGVTPDEADTPLLVARVRAALEGGMRLLQYRNKIADAALRRAQAVALCALCHEYGCALIINDHVDLALEVDADGVHLGGEDGSLVAARAKIGPHKLLGASCYRNLENGAAAIAAGADHIAFGSFFQSSVKPCAARSPFSLLADARRRFDVPIVAIGGITPDNAPQLIAAGAHSVAVITALFGAADLSTAARRFNALFETGNEAEPEAV